VLEVEASAKLVTLNSKIDELSIKSVKTLYILCSFCDGLDHLSINYGVGVGNEGDYEQINAIN
jgi:hypothetical protein